MSTADKLKRAKHLRLIEINRIQELLQIAQTAQTDNSFHSQFIQRYETIRDIQESFSKLHNAVFNYLPVDADEEYVIEDKVRTEFENYFYAVKTIYYDLFERNKNLKDEESNLPRPKLPELRLIKFNGDIKNFTSFIDVFEALVHNNSQLSNIEKFSHLLASLEGPPKNLVQTHPLTSANYTIAYDALKTRYSNKRLLATSHWNEIENSPRLTTENPLALRRLLDTFTENIAALKNLELPVNQWDFILTHMLLKRLDPILISRFETQYGSTDMPSFETLKEFISKQCIAYETISSTSNSFIQRSKNYNNDRFKNNSPQNSLRKSSSFLTSAKQNNNNRTCIFCNTSDHFIYSCPVLINKNSYERYNLIKQNKLCVNCLSHSHTFQNCNSNSTCKTCNQRHHSLLHHTRNIRPTDPNTNISRFAQNNSSQTSNENDNQTQNYSNHAFTANNEIAKAGPVSHTFCQFGNVNNNNLVLLSTVQLKIRDGFGIFQTARAILDSGSESCYISKNCVQRLGLNVKQCYINICGLGGMKTNANIGEVIFTITPLNKMFPMYDIHAIVLDKICSDMPICDFDISKWNHIKNINLADSNFNISSPIDLILGANIFNKILIDGQIPAQNANLPSAINTTFGYVLMGEISNLKNSFYSINSFFTTRDCNQLDNTISKFWSLEEIPQQYIMSLEDNQCEKYYSDTTFRLDSGRYVVSLPFINNNLPKFENSKLPALRRFYSLERRLISNLELYKEYCQIIQEYLDSGHMQLVSTRDDNAYYLPHHCVFKPDSTSTRVRIVFDASSKDSNNLSLNDTLMTGPKLQRDISSILLNFRLYSVVMTADIKGMYRQILINSAHYNFHRLLWRFSPDQPLKEYILKTVTFGVNCSPYLALRTIMQLANDEKQNFKLATNVLLSDIYVDDIVTGCNSVEEALKLQADLTLLLKRGGFELRKWASNNNLLLCNLPQDIIHSNSLHFDEKTENTIKILGLKWNPSEDTFSYSVRPLDKPCTKRNILSELARIYDPLGFLTPVTLVSKLLIQQLWSLKLEWDDSPPQNILNQWENYKSQLPQLSSIHIPRHIFTYDYDYVDLCGFSDGSLKAYSACVYARITAKDYIHTVLLCAKSKVAPLKRLSIPRIELCGAYLLTKLIKFVIETYATRINFKTIFAFTDSTVVLHWLNSSPHRWKPFVANRISIIQEKLPNANWQHVSSEDNVADCASRGLLPSEFVNFRQWWVGSSFLKKPYSDWPTQSISAQVDEINVKNEQRKIAFMSTTCSDFLENLLQKFSSLEKLQRVGAYVLRFIFNLKNPRNKQTSYFTVHDLQAALMVFIKHVQQQHFSCEIENIFTKTRLSKPFRRLGAFIDNSGIVRVGGRLKNSLLNYDKKYPIILPQNSHLTDLIIAHTHNKYFHPGVQTTQYLISQNYWILSSKRAIKKVLSKCIKCFRLNPLPLQPIMGNLPTNRVSQVKPFSVIGIDFGGPFFITANKYRGAKVFKSYICVFVCFATKAIHIELASDMSSENFLCALRRFIARRGKCIEIRTDQGTNFIGANKYLLQIIKSAATEEKIKWNFNPPHAPHFGGLHEAGIKSVKTHLSRVIGKQRLTYEELNTLIIQIESLLNSRPLCSMSNDPNDYSVLTPGHFLTLQPLTCIPDPDLSHLKLTRLDRYQLLLRLHRDFWARWHQEYLHTLQQKFKWNIPGTILKEGALVLIKQDNLPPMSWKLARVVKLFEGSDGIARVAEVRTNQGTYSRPLVKLCPLPEA